MKLSRLYQFSLVLLVLSALMLSVSGELVFAQSRRQPPAGTEKKNKRPEPKKDGETQEPLPADLVGTPKDADKITVTTQRVNVDAVVYTKKGGQIVAGLKKENFALFVDDKPVEITNFATPEAPITVVMVVEYSKWAEAFGYYGSGGFDPGTFEVIRPTAMFLTQFIKPPDDYVSVVAYDMRPTPLTDFTNDPGRINAVINLLLRNYPAFRESNMFDALKFTLVGGKGDTVALDDRTDQRWAEYSGLVSVQGRRRAVILIASGIDTFSKINYGEARKVLQSAGIPVYIIGTGNLFFKKYGDMLGPLDDLSGGPGRMTFLQADNTLKTFAKETGGAYYPVTFPGELPKVLHSINSLLRSQYSLAFNPGDLRDGKSHKIRVSIDVDEDGNYDDKAYVIQARQVFHAPKPEEQK